MLSSHHPGPTPDVAQQSVRRRHATQQPADVALSHDPRGHDASVDAAKHHAEPRLGLEDAEGVVAHDQVPAVRHPVSGREEPAVQRQVVGRLAAEPAGAVGGSFRCRAIRLALNDKTRNVQAAVMMFGAMRVALAKRERRRGAETGWL